MALVDESGAPRGERYFAIYNPPVVNRQLGIRKSALNSARDVSLSFLGKGLQTIVFAPSRLATEVLVTYLKEALETKPGSEGIIRGYRGGYLPRKRREIERGLREGSVLGVVSTNALELGIDIGSLDAAVLVGYPGSVASAWQQAGRAGRRSGTSVAVMVANSTPLNQFVAKNPDYFFGAPVEEGRINPENLQILVNHIKCAAFELPFVGDEPFGKENLVEILEYLEEQKLLHRAGERWHWTSESYPADAVSLRSRLLRQLRDPGRDERAADHRRGRLRLGAFDGPREGDLHPGGPHLLTSRSTTTRSGAPRCARPRSTTTPTRSPTRRCASSSASRKRCAAPAGATTARCTSPRRSWASRRSSSTPTRTSARASCTMPENEMHTTSYWLTVPRELMRALPYTREERRDGIVALSYTLGQLAALFLMCDRHDLGVAIGDNGQGEARIERGLLRLGVGKGARRDEPPPGEDYEPNVFVYDDYPGGIGLSEPLYRLHDRLLAESRALIAACACQDGCPSCVGPAGEVGSRGKEVALAILDAVRVPGA